ncbi:MAG: hypothetical protein KDG89_11135, partial [Geminicoccaceae bacterium]|nr:hypothetical protein [Geminicoccaceae bacterium]
MLHVRRRRAFFFGVYPPDAGQAKLPKIFQLVRLPALRQEDKRQRFLHHYLRNTIKSPPLLSPP